MSEKAAKSVEIRPASANRWGQFLKKAEQEHWRKLKVTIQFREKVHAGKPKALDAAKAMLRARGLEEVVEAIETERPVDERAEEVVDEGLCEFLRREGKPGIWFPANNIKAMMKENFGVLGYRLDARPPSAKQAAKKRAVKGTSITQEDGEEKPLEVATGEGKAIRGLRGAVAEGLFVVSCDPKDRDYIYLGERPDGIDQNVAHTMGPKGPQASIKRNEFLLEARLEFEVWLAKADAVSTKIPDESFADMMVHAAEHGLGANRSQGLGRFNVISIEDIEG
jgi:hypothetical protein